MKSIVSQLLRIVIILMILIIASNVTAQSIDFNIICQGDAGSFHEESLYIVENRHEFERLWKKSYCSSKPLPNINFRDDEIIAIFRGPCNSSGYGIKITSIVRNEADLIVNCEYTGTGGAMCIVTGPFILIKIKRNSSTIILNKYIEASD